MAARDASQLVSIQCVAVNDVTTPQHSCLVTVKHQFASRQTVHTISPVEEESFLMTRGQVEQLTMQLRRMLEQAK